MDIFSSTRENYITSTLKTAGLLLEGYGVVIDPDRWRKVADWLREKQSKRNGWQAAHHYLDTIKDDLTTHR